MPTPARGVPRTAAATAAGGLVIGVPTPTRPASSPPGRVHHAPRSRGRFRSGKAPPHPPPPAPCFPPLHGARAAQATPRLQEYRGGVPPRIPLPPPATFLDVPYHGLYDPLIHIPPLVRKEHHVPLFLACLAMCRTALSRWLRAGVEIRIYLPGHAPTRSPGDDPAPPSLRIDFDASGHVAGPCPRNPAACPYNPNNGVPLNN